MSGKVLSLTVKPRSAKAIQWDGNNVKEVCDFANWRWISHDNHTGLEVHTRDGTKRPAVGDWVVMNHLQEMTVMTTEQLDDTYNRAGEFT